MREAARPLVYLSGFSDPGGQRKGDSNMPHVELIQNEWAAGQQRVVAKVVLNGARAVQVEALSEIWEPIALAPFTDPDTGLEVSPEAEPERFVRALHRHLSGDYL